MLQIVLPETNWFNESTMEFVHRKEVTLRLEHSLISIQKWEARWKKSYLSSDSFTNEEQLDYIRCMSLDPNFDPDWLKRLTTNDFKIISDYINDAMTATTFSNSKKPQRKVVITAEIIYYWMVSFGIPFDCAKWHLNQLLALINVCSIKNAPTRQDKMTKKEISQQYASLNALRRAKLGSKG